MPHCHVCTTQQHSHTSTQHTQAHKHTAHTSTHCTHTHTHCIHTHTHRLVTGVADRCPRARCTRCCRGRHACACGEQATTLAHSSKVCSVHIAVLAFGLLARKLYACIHEVNPKTQMGQGGEVRGGRDSDDEHVKASQAKQHSTNHAHSHIHTFTHGPSLRQAALAAQVPHIEIFVRLSSVI